MSTFSLQIDFHWLATCTALIILMQAGFICLESGQVRSMNSISVAMKNIVDFCLAALIFWLFGYALMFGSSYTGVLATNGLMFNSVSPEEQLFFVYQLMFCCTAVTIISGAIAERMSLSGYVIVTMLTAGLIYPVTGHWIWSNLPTGGGAGWLVERGFYDYAGSTAVHSIGGWVALAAILIIGPRLGRFTDDDTNHHFLGSNIPIAALGAMLLFIGWLGFNGGNEYVVSQTIPRIFMTTILAAATGGLSAFAFSWWLYGKPRSIFIINGLLAGLVAITASCNVVSPSSVLIISSIGALISVGLTLFLEKLRIDDVVGAIPVHLGPGIWGTLSVALFADPSLWDGELNRWSQLQIQCVGILSCAVYAFGVSYLLLRLINHWHPLRVSKEIELEGLNFGELAAESALLELAHEMQRHEHNDSFNISLAVDPMSDTAPVARAYNKVVDHLNSKISSLTSLKDRLAEQATTDALTGVHNRGYFDEQFSREWSLAYRDQRPLSILMIDVDYFKPYNDTYGHQAGDACLKHVAHIITSALFRPADSVARYGGEEFVVILPNTPLKGATVVANLIQQRIRESEIPHSGSSLDGFLTLSIGAACTTPSAPQDSSALIASADKMLYRAKDMGRNRTECQYAPSNKAVALS